MHGHGEMLAVPSGMQCVFLAPQAAVTPRGRGPHHPVVPPTPCLAKMSQALVFH